jgi:hypothetical protein
MICRAYARLLARYPLLVVVVPFVLLVVIAISGVIAWRAFGFDWSRSDGDPWNYLAAGERLNAGHPLYALSPGDRPVVIAPPYWTVPLLAPPPIAVFWRPLALLGEPSMLLWGLAGLVGVAASSLFLARRGALLIVAILAIELWLVVFSGNATSLVLPMLIGAWEMRDRPWIVGSFVAVATSVKVLPVLLILWLVATGRWRAVAATATVGLAIVVVSVIGAGPSSFADWFAAAATAAPSPASVATRFGVAPWVVAAVLAIPIVLLGRRDRWCFGAAIVATTFATPAFYFSAWALLAALPLWRDRPVTSEEIGGTPEFATGLSGT